MRYARVVAGRRSTELREVKALLPENYKVIGVQTENIWIAGEDRAGWTLDDYVMPRLNSGLIYGNEVGLGEVPVAFRDLNPEYPDAEEPGG